MADMNLANTWEWNPITGDPFVPPNDSPNSRYCPTPQEMDEVGRQHTVENNLRISLFTFMTSNETQYTTFFDAQNSTVIRGYLRLVRGLDLKKIHLDYVMGGTLHMVKLPHDVPFHGEPYGIVSNLRTSINHSVYGLVADINHNAMLGWLGPGTFPCCKPIHGFRCNMCDLVGRSPTVNLGPHGQLELNKRAYCTTRNVVYVGVCSQCEEEETFSCYFGESARTLGQRCGNHSTLECNARSILKNTTQFPTLDQKRAEVEKVIAAGVDPDDVLRDWFSHVTPRGIHPAKQKMSVVDIISHPFLRKNRERNLVAEKMFHNGDFHYLGMGRGSLNTY